MLIGILQTGHVHEALVEENGDYDQIFQRFLGGQGFSFATWPVVDGVFPGGPDAADGWLLTGSKFGAYEDHPWIAPLEDLIRDIHASRRPMVGICFGHQIIAQALGGRVEKFEGGWSVGRVVYSVDGRDYALNAWHQDQVVEPPDGAEVVGHSAFCAHAALAIGPRTFTLQPHPEIDRTYLRGLLAERAPGVVPEGLQEAALAQLDAPMDDHAMAEVIAAFFRKGIAA